MKNTKKRKIFEKKYIKTKKTENTNKYDLDLLEKFSEAL